MDRKFNVLTPVAQTVQAGTSSVFILGVVHDTGAEQCTIEVLQSG